MTRAEDARYAKARDAYYHMRDYYPELAVQVRHAKIDLILGLDSMLETLSQRNGEYSKAVAKAVARGLNYSTLNETSVRMMIPTIEATAKKGYNPANTVNRIVSRMHSSEHMRSFLEAVAPTLEATAKSGHDPLHLANTLSSGLKSKAITPSSLPASAEAIRGALEAAANGGHKPWYLAYTLSEGLSSNAITHESLPHYLELLKAAPREWEPHKVLHNALEAHKMGVPADKIVSYQLAIAKHGQFPNAGLIHELHKAKMREKHK